MSHEQFWEGEASMVQEFIKAHELKKRQKNEELWLGGLYFYRAVSSALAEFGYGLGGGKGNRPQGYLEYPIPITQAEKDDELERKKRRTLAWVAKGQTDE